MAHRLITWLVRLGLVALAAAAACGDAPDAPGCLIEDGPPPPFTRALGCPEDFDALASAPIAGAVAGARAVKLVIDRIDGDALYFQDSARFRLHWDFARTHLSGGGLPVVADLARFNAVEYYRPDRRFVLGALTRYDAADAWAFELAPWDTASPDLIARAFARVADAARFAPSLTFHPTSEALARAAVDLPASIPTITTSELLHRSPFLPLNAATAMGRLRFFEAANLEREPTDLRDVAVLDRVPPDLGPVVGVITATPQTPLSHINVLAQDRGIPNMVLRGAFHDPALRALEGRWVVLAVSPDRFEVREVGRDAADAWWATHRPPPANVVAADVVTTGLFDIDALLAPEPADLAVALRAATRTFGAKASHYAALRRVGPTVPVAPAFAVPAAYYHRHLGAHGLDTAVADLLDDPTLEDDPAARRMHLAALRRAIEDAPMDAALLAALHDRVTMDFPRRRVRFRSSTNAEDLEGFSGAGLYASVSADPADPARPIADAVRAVWASLWSDRAFAERAWRGIDHRDVAMALLVNAAFTREEANGVALTANPFDDEGAEPAFFIAAQKGTIPVVAPPTGVSSDDFLYYFSYPSQPIVFLSRSNLVGDGAPVLTRAETFALGEALDAIHRFFEPVYGRAEGRWWAMDIEFKVHGPPGVARALWVKQARPAPRRAGPP